MSADSILRRTSGCCRFSHPEISVLVDRRAPSPDWLIEFFETEVGKGRVFRAGETVQVGWGLLLLSKNLDEDLEVWEPDFGSMPIQWKRGVNETIRHLTIQKTVAEALSCEPDFPSLLQPCSVEQNWKARDEFVMWRTETRERHSGWSWATELTDQAIELCSLYELGTKIPAVIAFFALPAGCEVHVTRKRITIRSTGRCVSSDDSVFLQRLLIRANG